MTQEVPAFQEGGYVRGGAFPTTRPPAGTTFGPGHLGFPEDPPEQTGGITTQTGPGGRVFVFDEWGSVIDSYFPTAGSSGGGGGGGGSSWLPGEYELQQRKLDLDQQQQQNQVAMADLDRAMQQAIANQDNARILQLEGERNRLSRDQFNYQQVRDQIDSEMAQQNFWQGNRGQDISQRGQDIGAGLDVLGLQNQQYGWQMQDAINRAQLQQTGQLDQRGQDISQRGQDLDSQIAYGNQQIQLYAQQRQDALDRGDLALAQDVEQRMRGEMQQNAYLQSQSIQMRGFEGGNTALQGAGNISANLAASLGQQQTQRASDLARTMANPRDFAQYQYMIGNGPSFLEQIASGQPMTGQSAVQGTGIPALGEGFNQGLAAMMDRPELALYEQAANQARQLGDRAGQAPQMDLDYLMGFGNNLPDLAPMPGQVNAPNVQRPYAAPVARETLPTPVDVKPPSMQYTPPPREAGPDPTWVLSPEQKQTFEDFSAAAPQVPLDMRIDIAQKPGEFRNLATPAPAPVAAAPRPATPAAPTTVRPLQPAATKPLAVQAQEAMQRGDTALAQRLLRQSAGFAKGGKMITDEPIMMIGMTSGEMKGTMGEPNEEYPEGAPELMKITPLKRYADKKKAKPRQFATGGSVLTPGAQILAQQKAGQPTTYGGQTISPRPGYVTPTTPGQAYVGGPQPAAITRTAMPLPTGGGRTYSPLPSRPFVGGPQPAPRQGGSNYYNLTTGSSTPPPGLMERALGGQTQAGPLPAPSPGTGWERAPFNPNAVVTQGPPSQSWIDPTTGERRMTYGSLGNSQPAPTGGGFDPTAWAARFAQRYGSQQGQGTVNTPTGSYNIGTSQPQSYIGGPQPAPFNPADLRGRTLPWVLRPSSSQPSSLFRKALLSALTTSCSGWDGASRRAATEACCRPKISSWTAPSRRSARRRRTGGALSNVHFLLQPIQG